MNDTIIVANRTGGQGKTVVSQLLIFGYEIAGLNPTRIAIDSVAEDSKSKLGKFCDDVREIRVSPDAETLLQGPKSILVHWDSFGKVLLDGNGIVDVGANVVTTIFDWAVARQAGRVLERRNAPGITLVVPTQAQAQALEDAFHLLERSISDTDGLPITQRVLLLNEAHGSSYVRLSSSLRDLPLRARRSG